MSLHPIALYSPGQRHKMNQLRVCLSEGVALFMSHTGSLSRILPPFVLLLAIGLGPLAIAAKGSKPADDQNKASADQPQPDQAKTSQTDPSGDPLKRPIEEKRRRENAKSLKHE